MVTKEEIRTYVNNLISNQDLPALCLIRGSNIIIRITGQYSKNQVEHLLNQYAEITDYIIQDGKGYIEIFYIYTEWLKWKR